MIDGMRESFFVAALSVGCGGFVGSVFRYCLSLIQVRWEFPMMTFVTNILGAVLIGMIAQAGVGVYLNAAEFFAFYEDWCLRRIYDIFYVFFGVGYTD